MANLGLVYGKIFLSPYQLYQFQSHTQGQHSIKDHERQHSLLTILYQNSYSNNAASLHQYNYTHTNGRRQVGKVPKGKRRLLCPILHY